VENISGRKNKREKGTEKLLEPFVLALKLFLALKKVTKLRCLCVSSIAECNEQRLWSKRKLH
jgi:hypothetical protein